MKLQKASIWFFAVVLLALGANAMFLLLIQQAYDSVLAAQQHREHALRLSNQLQQETEQLTRLVRAYTSTGEPRYLLYYYDILAVREGRKPPPVQSGPGDYWDGVIAGRIQHTIPTQGERQSITDSMKSQGFAAPELAALEQVLLATQALNKIEQTAFAATQGLYDPDSDTFVSDGQPRLDFASQLVHSAGYNTLKDKLSQAVGTLVATTDARSRAEVATAGGALARWIFLSLVSMAATITMTLVALRVIHRNVLQPIHRLGQSADKLAVGDYTVRNGPLHGFDELASMGRTVDAMAVAIEGDISHRKAVQLELEAARKLAEDATHAKSMFLANMSHEIRTPMNAILGMAYLALRSNLTARQHDYVSKIHEAAESLLGIINDILDFSKVEAGRLELDQGRFTVEDVAGRALSLLRHRAHEQDIELLFDVDDPRVLGDSGALMGDALRLGQVLTNLLSNAIKFTHQGYVKLMIEVEQANAQGVTLQFTVRDTGIGMNDTEIARLFKEFTQADGSTTRRYGGTGLGLTISKRIVELMDGRIWVESAPGKGSSFHFTARFDLTEPPAPPATPLPRADVMRVLVIDDQADARDALTDLLRALGVGTASTGTVDQADGGDTALAMIEQAEAEQHPYDMLLIDWVMPRLDGAGLLAALHERRQDGTTPLPVIVSAYDSDQLHSTADGFGARHFLPKPVLPQALRKLVERLTGERPLTDTATEQTPAVHDLTGLRVLLAEDNPINQQLAVELLQARGIEVDVAGNGQEAIEAIKAHRPDHYHVVLLDLQMPIMDGYEATRQLRLDAAYARLPLIAMTAHAMAEERERCNALGMNGHISKPIDPEFLYATLSGYLGADTRTQAEPPSTEHSSEITRPGDAPVNLPEIPGLDCSAGLRHAGGNSELYINLLRRFTQTHFDFVIQMRTLLDGHEMDAASRLVHTLRGLSATLGATTLLASVSRLDSAMKLNAPKILDACLDETGTLLSRLILDILAFLETDPSREPAIQAAMPDKPTNAGAAMTATNTQALLDTLLSLLSQGDNDARILWQANRPRLLSGLDAQAAQAITDAIENFDFDRAIELLRTHRTG